jgi:AbrB family looped-hinge helix DNA binding protein
MSHQRPETIRIREGGRIVIPAAVRAALGVGPGDDLIATFEDGEFRLTTRTEKIRRLQERVRLLDKGSGSVVDEFIAERRAEAERE